MSTDFADSGAAIRAHISTALTGSAFGIAWQNVDNRAVSDLPPEPDPGDSDATSYIEVYVQPNVKPWNAPGWADSIGAVLIKCFVPLHTGIAEAERLADSVANAFRKNTSNHTFDSGAGVFQPPEVKDIGPDDRGFYQQNVRVEWWHQQAA